MGRLELDHVSIFFTRYAGLWRQRRVCVVEDVHLNLEEGEVVAVVGASGSGKSLLAQAIMGILPDNAAVSGVIRYDGAVLDSRRQADLRGTEIAYIPQSVTALDPLMRVGRQVIGGRRGPGGVAVQELFRRLRLPEGVERLYPFQLSGGMARKVLVATAAAVEARLIVADEPTPGLAPDDVRVILEHLRRWSERGASVLLITHDLDFALQVAHRVAVFYAGTVVEVASATDFAEGGEKLRHPYTRALWRALPQNGFVPFVPPSFGTAPALPAEATALSGVTPASSPGTAADGPHKPEKRRMAPVLRIVRRTLPETRWTGCRYLGFCPMGTEECGRRRPELTPVDGGMVRCFYAM